MPLGDGTGPVGNGPGTGRGFGAGRGRGRMGGDQPGSGPGGACVCPSCGEKAAHTRGVPCSTRKCPKCGARMTKE
jgi:hypothetical protein